jgi:hypothetical protein
MVDQFAMTTFSHGRSGFTFIECLAGVLILTVGFFAVISLILFAQRLANRAQADASAMSTALSVAVDPAPLALSGDWNATGWTRAAYDLSSTGAIACETSGFVNGLYVVRREHSSAADIVAPGVRSVAVSVEVRSGANGEQVTSYSTRFLRQFTPQITP